MTKTAAETTLTQETHWPDGLRILCVRPDNLGDVLMTTPAFRAMKETWPACHLTLLTSSAGAAVAQYIDELDAVITFDVPWVAGRSGTPKAVSDVADRLRAGHYDAAVVFTVQSQNPLPAAMLCYLAGIPNVLGYCRENPYQLLTHWVPDTEILVATRHEVERQLALVESVGCRTSQQQLSLRIAEADRLLARQALVRAGVDTDRPWLVVHPGASEEKRRYPLDCFIEAADLLIREHAYQLVLTGTASERPLAETFRQQLGEKAVNLAGELPLSQFMGLLADAPLLLSNNTGPVHIAAALQTPVVVLYAKTNPQHTPWQVPSRVLYFDVPQSLRSRNVLLQQFPQPAQPVASPAAIVQAVRALSIVYNP
ncbi:glycosyltransferase family 9 protein [Spirosoma oryzicola]|uniref:glycosyltransferase family 9 protein n=1 Tax=Spirosoma oryzicola TaxID=2898794 RepID=UPI001E5BE550|nr:glycosyltransferase family 9 protein [Spirosoma oryzicola]UHG93577.1 glycosyltransferase family 9 protein [Spirosoma oryzicola]